MTLTITRDDADGMKGYLIEQGGLKVGILDNQVFERTGSTYLEDMTTAEILTYAEMLREATRIIEGDRADSAVKA